MSNNQVSQRQKEIAMQNQIVRQGDILIVPVDRLPECRPVEAENGLHILAHGEATGHHHSIHASNRITMFREDSAGGGLCFTVTDEPVQLVHQEHSTLTIQPGHYQVRRQRTMTAGLVRRVAD